MNSTRREFMKNLGAVGAVLTGGKVITGKNTNTASGSSLVNNITDASVVTRSNTDWFKEAKWGLCCHYLVKKEMSADEWNRQVNSFDTDRLANQLEFCKAKYFLITIGQNSGHYCSPNSVYDSIVGIQPSKCSERDLISDLSSSLAKRGVKLLVYLPAGAPDKDPVAVEKLQWEYGFKEDWIGGQKRKHTGKRLAEFQRNWEAVIREWSLRWGKKVCGWWIDGCYFADAMHKHPEPPNFQSFASALKAGNPESIVAFNPGVIIPVISLTEYEDYTAGETRRAFPVCRKRWLKGAQYHTLNYLGKDWGRGPRRFLDEFVIGYTREVNSRGGVVTWDVPISKSGVIPEDFIKIAKKIG